MSVLLYEHEKIADLITELNECNTKTEAICKDTEAGKYDKAKLKALNRDLRELEQRCTYRKLKTALDKIVEPRVVEPNAGWRPHPTLSTYRSNNRFYLLKDIRLSEMELGYGNNVGVFGMNAEVDEFRCTDMKGGFIGGLTIKLMKLGTSSNFTVVNNRFEVEDRLWENFLRDGRRGMHVFNWGHITTTGCTFYNYGYHSPNRQNDYELVARNTFISDKPSRFFDWAGLYVNASPAIIMGNTFKGFPVRIDDKYKLFAYNECKDSPILGVDVSHRHGEARHNIFARNLITGNTTDGIQVSSAAEDNKFLDNYIAGNKRGVYLNKEGCRISPKDNKLSGNALVDNGQNGVYVYGIKNTEISENLFGDNRGRGYAAMQADIYIRDADVHGKGNLQYEEGPPLIRGSKKVDVELKVIPKAKWDKKVQAIKKECGPAALDRK